MQNLSTPEKVIAWTIIALIFAFVVVGLLGLLVKFVQWVF